LGRPRIYATAADRQAAYRARSAERIQAALSAGGLRRIRKLENELRRAVRRAEKAEATVAELCAQLAIRPKPPRQRDAARIRELENLGAFLYAQLQAEQEKNRPSPARYLAQPSRAERRAAERHRRRP